MANRRPSEPPRLDPAPPVDPRRAVPKARTPGASPAAPRAAVSPEERRGMIAQNAYLRAQRRGFEPGQETEDWFAAEAEVDALLRAEHGSSPQ
ncbi:MAG TPA: DUF2934 domain-containing protein [Steroidobacteraceae bacterium]|jgi:hypothetical protein